MTALTEKDTSWGQFWHFNLGHLLIILGMLVSTIWWVISYDREFQTTKLTVAQLAATVEKISQRVERMDLSGTTFSQRGIARDDDFQRMTASRLQSIESTVQNFNVIRYQIDEISNWVKEQQQMQAQKKAQESP